MDTRTDILNSDQIAIGLATALTFDDVLLVPRHSQVSPSAVDVSSRVTRNIQAKRDVRFETKLDRPIRDIMTHDPLFTVPVGTTLEQAREILHRHKVEKLLVVDDRYMLKGLITVKDIQKIVKYPNACKDSLGRLRVAAAIGVGKDAIARAEA